MFAIFDEIRYHFLRGILPARHVVRKIRAIPVPQIDVELGIGYYVHTFLKARRQHLLHYAPDLVEPRGWVDDEKLPDLDGEVLGLQAFHELEAVVHAEVGHFPPGHVCHEDNTVGRRPLALEHGLHDVVVNDRGCLGLSGEISAWAHVEHAKTLATLQSWNDKNCFGTELRLHFGTGQTEHPPLGLAKEGQGRPLVVVGGTGKVQILFIGEVGDATATSAERVGPHSSSVLAFSATTVGGTLLLLQLRLMCLPLHLDRIETASLVRKQLVYPRLDWTGRHEPRCRPFHRSGWSGRSLLSTFQLISRPVVIVICPLGLRFSRE